MHEIIEAAAEAVRAWHYALVVHPQMTANATVSLAWFEANPCEERAEELDAVTDDIIRDYLETCVIMGVKDGRPA